MWYGLAAVPLFLGGVTALLLGLVFVRHVTGPLSRFSTERPLERQLPAGAERTIYSYEDPGDIHCSVTEVATGRDVSAVPSAGITLTIGDQELQSVARFEVERAGLYRVSCSAPDPTRLAVGPRLRVFREVGRVFAAIFALLGGAALAAVVVTIVAVRRHQHRRRLQGLP